MAAMGWAEGGRAAGGTPGGGKEAEKLAPAADPVPELNAVKAFWTRLAD